MKINDPTKVIITTIAAVHLEHFSSTFDIAEAKAELFQGMAGGTAILNRDNAYFPLLACLASSHGVARILGFGQHPEARLEGAHVDAQALEHVFEPFYTSKGAGPYRGLGLSQVAGFATQSGGGVGIVTELGKGTGVTIYPPLKAPHDDPANRGSTSSAAPRTAAG